MARTTKVLVLGAGSWGTALAACASQQADTLLWARSEIAAQAINQQHQNPSYLPGIQLPQSLRASASFDGALAHVLDSPEPDTQRLIILGVPMAGLADVCARLAAAITPLGPSIHVLWTCKGIHPESRQWPDQVVSQHLAQHPKLHLGVIAGPSFAYEVAQGLPVALTVASHNAATGAVTQDVYRDSHVRVYTTTDIIGVQVGGALKNVIAVACGISDGLQLGTNARAALITRGLAEIKRLGVAMGGLPATFNGLTGLGDLVLTATGDLSRNRQVGLAIGAGTPVATVLAQGTTTEGVRCARAALALAQQHHLDLPIIATTCQVLFDGLSPSDAVTALLTRATGAE